MLGLAACRKPSTGIVLELCHSYLAQVSALVGGAAAGALVGRRPATLAAGAVAGAAVGVLAHVATFRYKDGSAARPLNPGRNSWVAAPGAPCCFSVRKEEAAALEPNASFHP